MAIWLGTSVAARRVADVAALAAKPGQVVGASVVGVLLGRSSQSAQRQLAHRRAVTYQAGTQSWAKMTERSRVGVINWMVIISLSNMHNQTNVTTKPPRCTIARQHLIAMA